MLNSLPAIILARLFASAGEALWQMAACVAPAAGRQLTMGHRTTKSKKRDKIMPGPPVGLRDSGCIRKRELTCVRETLGSSAFKNRNTENIRYLRLVSGFLMDLIGQKYEKPGTKQPIICMVLCRACGKGVHIMGCGGEIESFWL